MKIKPEKLNKGDMVGIISPSGSIRDEESLDRAVKYFESRGYKVKLASHSKDQKDYLAGEDTDRLSDLENFFKDDEVKAIMCTRGGYGAFRILDRLDFNIIKDNPKIFVGYSDITALLNNFTKKTGLVTFHGPLFASDFGGESVDKYTEENFWKIVEGNAEIPYEYDNISEYHCITPGETEGELVGGNLAIICGLTGTPYMPDLNNKILFLEDISEPLYKIDRMIMQLKLSGVLENLKGLLFTEFTELADCDKNELVKTISELTGSLNIPIGYGFPSGHGTQKATLPLGVKYFFNSTDFKLSLLENPLQIKK